MSRTELALHNAQHVWFPGAQNNKQYDNRNNSSHNRPNYHKNEGARCSALKYDGLNAS